MNKAELVAAVAEKTGFTKKDAELAVNAFVSSVENSLVKGEKVQLIGFGTFEVRQRKARQGRNPRKPGEVIKIAASKAPVPFSFLAEDDEERERRIYEDR